MCLSEKCKQKGSSVISEERGEYDFKGHALYQPDSRRKKHYKGSSQIVCRAAGAEPVRAEGGAGAGNPGICTRTASGVTLTAEGQRFLEFVDRTLHEEQQMKKEIEDIRHAQRGVVKLGFTGAQAACGAA